MIRITQLKLPITHTRDDLIKKASSLLRVPIDQIKEVQFVRQSLDARKKQNNELYFVYTVDLTVANEAAILKKVHNNNVMLSKQTKYEFPDSGSEQLNHPPVIIGCGPAGLFCGYMLAKAGYKPLILERGASVKERKKDVERFWEEGVLNPDSNVQFGEGGAGTFSDGKLNTLVKDPVGRGKEVLRIFVEMGAPEEILYQQKPHLGTDVLFHVVKNLRQEIERLGGSIRFLSKVNDVLIENDVIAGVVLTDNTSIPVDALVLAPGHSARDTFAMLHERHVPMNAKSFAVGVRIEHPQEMINLSQYGQAEVKKLGAASYKLTHQTDSGRGIYTFCMCPGGYVVNASSEEGFLAVNGMSYQARDAKNANSALIVTVTPEDYASYNRNDVPNCLSGVAFQRELEKRAYEAGKGNIPVQTYEDYKKNQPSIELGDIKPCMKGAYTLANVRTIFPKDIAQAIEEGIDAFGRKIKGYDRPDALLSGVESRSSSPVRIERDEAGESRIKGLYPCGEGAGYAGGITSAAMDGIKIAESIAKKYMNLS